MKALVVSGRIDVHQASLIRDRDVQHFSRVFMNDRFCASVGGSRTKRVKHPSIEQNRVSVTVSDSRTHDWSARATPFTDDLSNRRRRQHRNVDQRYYQPLRLRRYEGVHRGKE